MTEEEALSKKEQAKRKSARTRHRKKFNALLEKADTENPKTYQINESYEPKDVLEHEQFGVGVVVKVLDKDKINVAFEEDIKTLVQNR